MNTKTQRPNDQNDERGHAYAWGGGSLLLIILLIVLLVYLIA